MKKLLYIPALFFICLCTWSCTPDLYTRPVTIDKLEFTNNAGQKYDYQFNRVNSWFLQKIEALETEKQTFKIDTTAKKRYRKYNHTLVATLDNLVIREQPGMYYQLYLRPNSGIGKMKGGVQEDKYNELKLFSPEKIFLQHEQQYYTDSIVAGPFNRVISVQQLLEPVNIEQSDIISFAIDSINFSKGFNKRQREGIIRVIHNSVVLEQRKNAGKDPKKHMVFNYYPNYKQKNEKKPALYVVNLNVTQDIVSGKILVKASSPGFEPEKFTWTEAKINRRDYLDGHTYEAKAVIDGLAPAFFRSLYRSRQAQSRN